MNASAAINATVPENRLPIDCLDMRPPQEIKSLERILKESRNRSERGARNKSLHRDYILILLSAEGQCFVLLGGMAALTVDIIAAPDGR